MPLTMTAEREAELAAWLALGAETPHGLSVVMDAACEMAKLRDQRLAETQAITRELLDALEEFLSSSHSDFPYGLAQAIARAKGVLPAAAATTDQSR